MNLSQEQIDKIYKITNGCGGIIILIGVVAMFFKPASWVWWMIGVLFVITVIVNFISGHWATDEEQEDLKRMIKQAVQEAKEEKPTNKPIIGDKRSPLINPSEKQEAVIVNILRQIPESEGHIKTSELIQILRALKGQGDLDDSDLDRVIYWVETVTAKNIDVRNFKYDYIHKFSESKVIKWGNIIRAEFDKIENS